MKLSELQDEIFHGQIQFEGFYPESNPGLLPFAAANWDGAFIKLHTTNLERGEKSIKYLAHCANTMPKLVEALQYITYAADGIPPMRYADDEVFTIQVTAKGLRDCFIALADAEEVDGI